MAAKKILAVVKRQRPARSTLTFAIFKTIEQKMVPGPTAELLRAALMKPANSDLYTREMAAFVEAFATHATPEGFPHHFWVSGGALAIENALKTAFDWKARKLGRTRMDADANELVILHFRQVFHGRPG